MQDPVYAAITWSRDSVDRAQALIAAISPFLRSARGDQTLVERRIHFTAAPKLPFHWKGRHVSVRIAGTLHVTDMLRLRRELTEALTADDAAQAIIRNGWGAYLAFVDDGRMMHVFRDPSGAVPLFAVRTAGLSFATNHVTADLLKSARLPWEVQPESLAATLAYPPIAGLISAVRPIETIAPGCLVALARDQPIRRIWDPSEIARRPRAPEAGAISAALDQVLRSIAADHRVGVELSGGFDSSLVFSSLAQHGFDARPFNVATASKGGNESAFAQEVASRHDRLLRCYSIGTSLPDYRALDDFDHGVLPVTHGLDSEFAAARQDHVARERLDVVMTGQGGDAAFFRLPTRLVAVDRARALGAKSLFSQSTIDDAKRVGGSIWSILATAFGGRWGDDRTGLEPLTPHLLGSAALRRLGKQAPVQPWLENAQGLPPAKAFHLMMLSHCQLFHGRRLYGCSVPIHHPLLTQPVLEIMIATPTFVLQQGSRDRALARTEFRDRLPSAVLARRGKGEASDHYARAALRNREWLSDRLLEGELAKADLLHRSALEEALRPDRLRLGTDYRALLHYAIVESWFRRWS